MFQLLKNINIYYVYLEYILFYFSNGFPAYQPFLNR